MLSLLFILAAAPVSTGEELVLVQDLIPDAIEELRYATEDNFMKRAVYPKSARCYLRRSVAEKLSNAAEALRAKGYRFKLYDCYRPLSVQWELWKILPKPGYVADPRKGSNHNRGAAVDLTLVTLEGGDVEMPTPYDSFALAAHHAYAGGTASSRKNRELLRETMEAAGFKKNKMEWWHYDAKGLAQFKVMDEPFTK
ncbi:MAG: M15 family metallopeptidase [Myxococcaceae bacterium]